LFLASKDCQKYQTNSNVPKPKAYHTKSYQTTIAGSHISRHVLFVANQPGSRLLQKDLI
jgi:hypothetical protein